MSGQLAPPGTRLKDVPPDQSGLPITVWEQLRLKEICAEHEEQRKVIPRPAMPEQRISTSRDNYGWRSLRGGTAYFGPDPRK